MLIWTSLLQIVFEWKENKEKFEFFMEFCVWMKGRHEMKTDQKYQISLKLFLIHGVWTALYDF